MDSRAFLYDNLRFWERRRRMYPVHKKLLPFTYKGTACSDVNDLWQAPEFSANDRLLDIGCGVGNTLITLAKRIGLGGAGISISAAEVEAARQNAVEAGVAERCSFICASFEAPFQSSFTRAIAIESIKHSHNLRATAAHIFSQATTGARFFLIDDCYTGNREGTQEKSLMKDWALSRLYAAVDFISAFTDAGFVHVEDTDLTAQIIPRSAFFLQLKIFFFGLMLKLPLGKVRSNLLSVYRSGFVLEKLFAEKKMEYRLLVFRRPSEA
jgi:SAM-dependent methyltransferase